MKTAVQVRGLRKEYGATVAVDDISFEVYEGEIFGMVGPNGAGKTTTIECVEGLRTPDAGDIHVLGIDVRQDADALRERTGVQLQESMLPDRMRVWEALDLYASFYRSTADWRELLVQLGLEEKRDSFFSRLSGGQKQRLFVALALLPDPPLVFLDELTTGLDPQARRTIWALVEDVRARGKTVVLSSHFMEEAERLCDRVAILDHGRIVALDSPSALVRSLGAGERVVFTLESPPDAALSEALAALGDYAREGNRITVRRQGTGGPPLVAQVVGLLSARAVAFSDLRTEQPTLEDVYLALIGPHAVAGGAA